MATFMEDYLRHFGVKGMRWGVRRSGSPGADSSHDVKKAAAARAKISGRNTNRLSNEELQSVITRMNLEKQFSTLNPSRVQKGAKFIKDNMNDARTINEVLTFHQSPLGRTLRTLLR